MAVSPLSDTFVVQLRSALAYTALFAGVFSALPAAGPAGAVAVCVAVALGWRDLNPVSRVICLLVVIAGLAALITEPGALPGAATNMTRLSALLITVMLLSSILGRSRDLASISRSLFLGRPLARYFSVAFGTTFVAIPLNFGSVGVVASMIRSEIDHNGDSAMTRNAARAVLRGFGASPICSPLSVSVVITLTFLPVLQAWQLIAVSLPLAVCYLLCSSLFREQELAAVHEAADAPESRGQRLLPWLRFAAIIGGICVATFTLSGLAGQSYSRAVILSCLGAVILGLMLRRWQGEPLAIPSMAPMSNELVIMGGSAFLGAIISHFALVLMGGAVSLPDWAYPVVALMVPFVFFLGGMGGLNPIVIGSLTGGVLSPIWPETAALGLAIAMVSGWGLTTAGTPFSANSLLLARLTGYSARVAARRWNLTLSLTFLAGSGLLAAMLTVILAGQ
jgi:hypothetical protein